MREEHATKVCRICYEVIDERAKRCPHCLQWQSKSALLRYSPVVSGLLLMALLIAAWVVMGSLLVRAFRGSTDYVVYQGQLQVVESRMLFGESAKGPVVFVVGTIKNTSAAEWKDIHLQARFKDPEGKLIDVKAESTYSRRIMPHGEMAFKAAGPAELPKERYAAYEVGVVSAEDARRGLW
jgi:hypothetical protein